MRALGSFDIAWGTLGLVAVVVSALPAARATAQARLDPELEQRLVLEPPDLGLLPPLPVSPPPRYELRARLDTGSGPTLATDARPRLLLVLPGGFRVWATRSLTLGSSGGLAPTPGSIDPRATTERHQLGIDSPRGWSLLVETAVHDPRAANGARVRSYFVGLMAPPGRRVRMGFGGWGGGGASAFGLVLRW